MKNVIMTHLLNNLLLLLTLFCAEKILKKIFICLSLLFGYLPIILEELVVP